MTKQWIEKKIFSILGGNSLGKKIIVAEIYSWPCSEASGHSWIWPSLVAEYLYSEYQSQVERPQAVQSIPLLDKILLTLEGCISLIEKVVHRK